MLLCTCALPLQAAESAPSAIDLANFGYHTWSVESGLPQVTVNALQKDHKGFMWVGTENGLARFDGLQFEVFDTGNTPQLQSNWIRQLLAAPDGDTLWIATLKGLVRYSNNNFETIKSSEKIGSINVLAQDNRGTLWIGGDQLWSLIDGRLIKESRWQGEVVAIAVHDENIFIADRSNTIHRLHDHELNAYVLPLANKTVLVTGLAWHADRLWVATDRGLYFSEPNGSTLIPFSASGLDDDTFNEPIHAISNSVSGNLWIANEQSIYLLRNGRYQGKLDKHQDSTLTTLKTIYPDDNDGFWVGSLTSGLRHYWSQPTQQLDHRQGLLEAYTWSFWQDSDALLVGTNSGVYRFKQEHFEPYIDAEKLPGGVAYSLLRDRQKNLWVGTRQALVRFDLNGQNPKTFQDLHGLQINGLLESKAGHIYVASSAGLFQLHQQSFQPVQPQQLGSLHVRFLLQDNAGDIWIGTQSGLWQKKGEKIENSTDPFLRNAFITCITQLNDGRLIIGTYQDGIFIQRGDEWQHITTAQGLPANGLTFIEQHDQWLWVLYQEGIYRIETQSLTANVPEVKTDMVLHDLGDQPGSSRHRCCNGAGNGKGLIQGNWLWAPSLAGVKRVDLRQTLFATPNAFIKNITAGPEHLIDIKKVPVRLSSRDITVQYGAIDYQAAKLLRFRYRLMPYQQEWVDAAQRLSAFYTNLPPGNFRFEVQAKHTLGRWGSVGTLKIETPEQFVESWTFKTLVALVFLALVAATLRWRTYRLNLQRTQLQEIVTLRTRELQEANSKLANLNQVLHEASVTDALTGLRNRRFIQEQIPNLIARLNRIRQIRGTDWVTGFFLIDLDHFKNINDKYGHDMGDSALVNSTKQLNKVIRQEDYLLRWGGEEFLLLVPEVHIDQIPLIAERLRTAVLQTANDLLIEETISASIGYACLPMTNTDQPIESWRSTLAIADFALYQAKAAGRNCTATLNFLAQIGFPLSSGVSSEDLQRWADKGYITSIVERGELILKAGHFSVTPTHG